MSGERLRVIVGRLAEGAVLPDGGLTTLYEAGRLTIQGDTDTVRLAQGNRELALLVGEVVGVRHGAGALRRPSSAQEAVGVALRADHARWREELEGRFILLRVDGERAVIESDRFGQKELYLQRDRGATVLATDLSLLSIAPGAAGYDQAALAHTLCIYGYRPPKRHTLYRDVRRLGVGEWVEIAEGAVRVAEHPFQPLAMGAYGERELQAYAKTLLDAVALRGSRHGNVVYLSSGWDSTALLACLVKVFGPRKVRAVIGRMQYAERSGVINQFEIDRARAVADYFGVRLDVVEFDYRAEGPAVAERLQPLLRSHQFHSLAALNEALLAEGVARTADRPEVVFAGEISDGAHNLGFSQFTTIFHPMLEFREYSDKMASYLFGPTFLGLLERGQGVHDVVYQLLRGRCGEASFDEPSPDRVTRRMQLLAGFFLRAHRIPLWSVRNHRLLTAAGQDLYSHEMEETYLRAAAEALTPETVYAWLLHLYNSFHWQGSTVAPMAITARAQGLRLVLPFWDSWLQAFLSAMPESWGRSLDLNPTKYPLKWMLKHRIDYPLHLQTGPHSYLYDVDPNFSHGAEILYGSAFTPYFRTLLKGRPYDEVLSHRVFDRAYIEAIVERYLQGTEVRGAEMNDLLALAFLSMVGWYGGSGLSETADSAVALRARD
ncbi:MAG: hypothetical protein HYY58_01410 [Candidatus Omnitrophica bacterium]|nr:hypothetical protein [Candidatus Omnitrophota bacterium]